jgi:hypothetical protein
MLHDLNGGFNPVEELSMMKTAFPEEKAALSIKSELAAAHPNVRAGQEFTIRSG